jgi:hypothetical protein
MTAYFEPQPGLYYYIKSLLGSDMVMTVNSLEEEQNVYTHEQESGNRLQQWAPVPSRDLDPGWHVIINWDPPPPPLPPNNKCMDVEAANIIPGTDIILWWPKQVNNQNQAFRFPETATPGYYYIENQLASLVMDVYKRRETGAPIITWAMKTSGYENQAWKFEPALK